MQIALVMARHDQRAADLGEGASEISEAIGDVLKRAKDEPFVHLAVNLEACRDIAEMLRHPDVVTLVQAALYALCPPKGGETR